MNNDDSLTQESMTTPRYTVGEVAERLGLHPQTLRFYDSKGLIVPLHSGDTGRRYYSSYDVYKITLCKQYRNMGFSLAEIKKFFNECSLDQLLILLSENEEKQKIEIRKRELYLAGTQRLREKIANIPLYLNKCFYMRQEATWRHAHLVGNNLCVEPDSTAARRFAMETLPLTVYSFRFRKEQIETAGSQPVCIWDIALEQNAAELYGFNRLAGSYYMPETFSVYTVFKIDSLDMPQVDNMAYVFDFLAKNNLRLAADIVGNVIGKTSCGPMTTRYFEAWFPVAEAEK